MVVNYRQQSLWQNGHYGDPTPKARPRSHGSRARCNYRGSLNIHEYKSSHTTETPRSGITSMVMPIDNPRMNDTKEARATYAPSAAMRTSRP